MAWMCLMHFSERDWELIGPVKSVEQQPFFMV